MRVTGGHHDVSGVDDPVGSDDTPATGLAMDDPFDGCVEAHVDAALAGVFLEVPDHLVSGREDRSSLVIRAFREMREPSARVEPEPVVARPPGRAHLAAAVEHHRADRKVAEAERRREAGGPRTDDHHLVLGCGHP